MCLPYLAVIVIGVASFFGAVILAGRYPDEKLFRYILYGIALGCLLSFFVLVKYEQYKGKIPLGGSGGGGDGGGEGGA